MAASFTADATTITTGVSKSVLGFHVVSGSLNLGASYATGGVAVDATTFGGAATDTLQCLICGPSQDGVLIYSWDEGNGKVIAYDAFATEEGAGDISAAAKNCRCIAIIS